MILGTLTGRGSLYLFGTLPRFDSFSYSVTLINHDSLFIIVAFRPLDSLVVVDTFN